MAPTSSPPPDAETLAGTASAAGVFPWKWGIVGDGGATLPASGAFEGVHPGDVPGLLRARDAALASRNGHFAAEYRVDTPAGEARREARGRVQRASDGSAAAIVGVSFDAPQGDELEPGRYHALFETSPSPKWVFDPRTLAILDVNQAACDRYGYTRDEFLRLTLADLRPEEDREPFVRALAETGPEFSRRSVRHLTRDGRGLEVEVTVRPIPVPGGGVARLATVHDRTPERAAAHAARVSDAMFHSAVDRSLAGFYMVRKRRVVYANPRVCEILGYTAGELYAVDDVAGLVVPEERARVLEMLRRREAGGEPAQCATRLRRRDGSVAEVEIYGSSVEIDGHYFATATLVDVTERRRVERALYESEERYRAILRHYPDGAVLLFDHDLRFLVAEGQALTVLGHNPGALVGRRLGEVVTAATADLLEPMYLAALAGEERAFVVPARGHEYDCRALPLRDAEGRVIAGMVVARDVSEQRRQEAVRETLEAQLRQSQKMEAVGRLAGGIAHDFNNILTVITANTEFLLEALDPADPRHQDARDVREAAARAAALTRQLLAFSRRQLLAPQVLDLNRAVEVVRPMLARLIGEDVAMETRAAPGLGAVLADAGQLEQVLLNLAVNARDAMPNGGRLRIETAERQVAADGTGDEAHPAPCHEVPPGRYVTLMVSDTGTGMSPEITARIFEPFFTTKPHGRGTGLGLSTVYGIVAQSGGHVCVHSTLGEGSTFTVWLPRVDEEAASAPGASPVPEARGGSETVLLVEDEEAVRTLARRSLERQGYTVVEARNGAAALDAAAAHDGPIHLLLTDVVMPEIAGPSLVERLTALRPGLAVLYMSGYTDDEIVRRGVLASETPFLQKPFTPAALVSAVREVLDRST